MKIPTRLSRNPKLMYKFPKYSSIACTFRQSLFGLTQAAENALLYGAFIQSVIDFFIIAFCIFLFLRVITKAKSKFEKKVEEEAPAPAGPTSEELLAEIRDLLKDKQ